MDYSDPVLKRELKLLTLVVNFGFQEGWITENEQLQITTKETLDNKNIALLKVLKNAKCDENAARLLLALRSIKEMTLDLTSYSDTETEGYCLSIIMSKLLTKGLVTEERKLIYENRVKVMENSLEKHELENSKKEEKGSVKSEIDDLQIGDSKRNPTENYRNPLLNHLVIKCVLQHLKFKEVKNARHISKIWSSVGLIALKACSKIVFSLKRKDRFTEPTDRDQTPVDFLSVFPFETLEKVPFTSFSISIGDTLRPWTIEEIEYFFRSQKKHIKELKINEMNLVKENRYRIIEQDYSSWIINSAMTKANTKYNTELEISGIKDRKWHKGYDEITFGFVQLNALANIKVLRLSDIRVELQDGIVISPTKIEMNNISFRKNGSNLLQVCVNKFIDFSKTKEILMTSELYEDDSDNDDDDANKETEMILEMDRNSDIKLDFLSLSKITVKHSKTCRWTVNHLCFENTPFDGPNMEIKKITLQHCQVNISNLPLSVENLSISLLSERNCECSHPIVLPNLKFLTSDFVGGEIADFINSGKFKFPNLVELDLTHRSDFFKELHLTWLPQTLKTLQLKSIWIKDGEVDHNLKLDKLAFSDYHPIEIGKICKTRIQTKNLILSFHSRPFSNSQIVDALVNFLGNQNICRGQDRRIFVGELRWEWQNETSNIGFSETSLNSYVDRKSKYYVFENEMGKAVNFEEYDTLMP